MSFRYDSDDDLSLSNSYSGDEDEETSFDIKEGRIHACSTTTMSLTPISIKDLNHNINPNVSLIILPKNGRFIIYCYLFDELVEFIKKSPPLFLYKDNSPDENFPAIKLSTKDDTGNVGVYIDLNYFLLLRYTAFVLYSPREETIGSIFGVSTLHGAVEKIYKVCPISKTKFLSDNKIDIESSLSFTNKYDYTPGNFPPYKTEINIVHDDVIEKEKSSDNTLIENIFNRRGDFHLSLYDDDVSHNIFNILISYKKDRRGFYSDRKFSIGFESLSLSDTVAVIEKSERDYIVEIKRGGLKVMREHITEDEDHEEIVDEEADAEDDRLWGGVDESDEDDDGEYQDDLDHRLRLSKTLEKVNELVEEGANPLAVGNDGSGPLHFFKSIDAINRLLYLGVDINMQNMNGDTALHYTDNIRNIRFLISKGADTTIRNRQGLLPRNLHSDEIQDLYDELEDQEPLTPPLSYF